MTARYKKFIFEIIKYKTINYRRYNMTTSYNIIILYIIIIIIIIYHYKSYSPLSLLPSLSFSEAESPPMTGRSR